MKFNRFIRALSMGIFMASITIIIFYIFQSEFKWQLASIGGVIWFLIFLIPSLKEKE